MPAGVRLGTDQKSWPGVPISDSLVAVERRVDTAVVHPSLTDYHAILSILLRQRRCWLEGIIPRRAKESRQLLQKVYRRFHERRSILAFCFRFSFSFLFSCFLVLFSRTQRMTGDQSHEFQNDYRLSVGVYTKSAIYLTTD